MPDGLRVKLLPGTDRGQVGEIVVLSYQHAVREIKAGRAIAVDELQIKSDSHA